MKRTNLSKDLSISSIVQGFWRLAGWHFSADELATFMNACIDRGVTTFDTAEIYAGTACEKQMGEAFRKDPSIRGRIQLISKTGIVKEEINGETVHYYDTSYTHIINACKESLKRLDTDFLDLYLIHREDPFFDVWETARALLDLKKAGLVREIGVSNFDPMKFNVLNEAVSGALVTNQIEWNPVCFEHFNTGMIDYLTYKRIHPLIWSPLAGGRIFKSDDPACTKAMKKINEIAERHNEAPQTIIFAWIMDHPVGAVPLSGSSNLDHLDLAIRALDVKIERYEWYELYTASGQQVLR